MKTISAAGVHAYVETDDVVSADRHFLAITATEAGPKYIRLPNVATVQDIFESRQIGAAVDHFEIQMEAGETRLFELR